MIIDAAPLFSPSCHAIALPLTLMPPFRHALRSLLLRYRDMFDAATPSYFMLPAPPLDAFAALLPRHCLPRAVFHTRCLRMVNTVRLLSLLRHATATLFHIRRRDIAYSTIRFSMRRASAWRCGAAPCGVVLCCCRHAVT